MAAPPTLVSVGEVLHLFWLDRVPNATGGTVVRYAIIDPDGNIRTPPRSLAAPADSRFGWPVAVVADGRIILAWMARIADTVQLMAAVLGSDGTIIRAPIPVGPPAEESGQITMVPSGGRIHVAWSQFDHGERKIWYLRMSFDGSIQVPARAVAPGDAATLVPGSPLRLLYWSPTGIDTYRLVMAEFEDRSLGNSHLLTGTLLLPRLMPVVAIPASNTVDLLLPVLERAFGASGRLYHIRVHNGEASPREAMPTGPVADVAAFPGSGQALIVWSQATGRKRNSEVFTAVFDTVRTRLLPPDRITYTPAGSIRPSIISGDGWRAAAWLEVAGITRFQVAFAGTRHPRRTRFLLGAPELDLYRPGPTLGFAVTVLASTLPYALLFTIAFGLPALGLALLSGGLFGSFAWWERLRARRRLRLYLFLLLVALLQMGGRFLVPGAPTVGMLMASLLVVALAALPMTKGTWFRQELGVWITGGAVLVVQFLSVLFPWGVQQLSQY